MAEQLLHGADVVARLQQVRGKGVAQRVRRGGLLDAGLAQCELEGTLEVALQQVVAPPQAGARIDGGHRLRKDPLPGPGVGSARVLARQRIGHVHARQAFGAVGLPHLLRVRQLIMQGLLQRSRQHHDTVFAALAFAHDDGAAVEIDVLDTQAQTFQQPHPGAIEQAADDAMRVAAEPSLVVEPVQQQPHLLQREHGRQAPVLARPADFGHPGQLLAEDLLIQEQQRRQGLPVGACRHLPVRHQPTQKGLDFRLRQLGRVAEIVEPNERPHPVDIRLFRAQAVVQQADLLAELIEQAKPWRGRVGWQRHRQDSEKTVHLYSIRVSALEHPP